MTRAESNSNVMEGDLRLMSLTNELMLSMLTESSLIRLFMATNIE